MKATPRHQHKGLEWEAQLAKLFKKHDVKFIHHSEEVNQYEVDFILRQHNIGVDAKYTDTPINSRKLRYWNGKYYAKSDVVRMSVNVLRSHKRQMRALRLKETYFVFKVEFGGTTEYRVISVNDMMDIFRQGGSRRTENTPRGAYIKISISEDTFSLQQFIHKIKKGEI